MWSSGCGVFYRDNETIHVDMRVTHSFIEKQEYHCFSSLNKKCVKPLAKYPSNDELTCNVALQCELNLSTHNDLNKIIPKPFIFG